MGDASVASAGHFLRSHFNRSAHLLWLTTLSVRPIRRANSASGAVPKSATSAAVQSRRNPHRREYAGIFSKIRRLRTASVVRPIFFAIASS